MNFRRKKLFYRLLSSIILLCCAKFSFAQKPVDQTLTGGDEKRLRAAIIKIESAPGGEKLDENFTYASKRIDLNGDGRDEIIVWIPEENMGGTSGYPILVLTRTATGYKKLMDIDQGWTPVIALDSKQKGWRDLAFQTGGGGGEWQYLIYKYTGQRYKQVKTQKEAPAGETLIEKTWQKTVLGPVAQ